MKILYYNNAASDVNSIRSALTSEKRGTVVALGFFDGMHKAHRELLRIAKEKAIKTNVPLTVFTFSGKSTALKPDTLRLLTDREKLALLEECGADFTLMCDFEAVAHLTAEEFVEVFLHDTLNASVAVCGYNFRFGCGASGTAEDLSALMKKFGGEAIIADKFYTNGTSPSSTLIRKLLSERKLRRAWELIGIPYFITGEVEHGKGIGTGMGIPTVNTELSKERFSLPAGVYSTAVCISGKIYRALTNIGTCPTFGKRHIHAETYILDFSGNLYNKEIRIYFIDYLREEKSFSNRDELIRQINEDKNKAYELGKEIKWQEIGLN